MPRISDSIAADILRNHNSELCEGRFENLVKHLDSEI